MRRLLLLPCGLALGVLAWGGQAASQPGPGFGAGKAPPAVPGLPGVVPDGPAPAARPAPPPNPYPITPDAGPWMICAAHYGGPDAPELARQVVLDLRNRHRLNAYIFNQADQERQKLNEEFERRRQQYPGVPMRRRMVRVEEECAVLAGGYKDFDSASAALKDFKKLPMPELKLGGGKSAYDEMVVPVASPEVGKPGVQRTKVNPYASATVARNPTVPAPPKPVVKFDPFWKELNSGEKYSLLRCRKNFTLVVKEYHGGTVVQSQGKSSGFLNMIGLGDKPGERLGAAGQQAHHLAEFLSDRRLGFEAYVLHTRNSSIVTVGGFNSLEDPELQRTQQRLAALKFTKNPNQPGADPIGLMASPLPMEVPRP